MLFPSLIHFLISPAQAELSVSELSAGDLVISEIMHDPVQVFDYKGEWLEIYNNSGDSVDLNGLILQDNTGESITVSGSLLVANGDYVVLGARDVPSQNGGATVDYRYNRNDYRLNPSDAVILSNGTTTIDSVTYNTTSTFPPAVGASLNLGSLSSDNSLSSSWCESSSSYGDGDLGTPGSANDSCGGLSDLSAGDLIITELMPDPTKTADYRGEWFEIYNNTSSNINLNGLVIGGSGSDPGETVSDNVYISPGGYALFAVRSGSFDNGGMTNVDYKYSYNNMKMLLNGDLVSISFGGTTFDSVSYTTTTVGGDFPSAVGQSISLSSTTYDASSNNNGSNWCTPTATYGDGDFGTPGAANAACANADADGDGFTGADGDCDDTNSDIFPGAPETCDGVDNNCSGDETDASDTVTFYADDDGDTYGDNGDTTQACSGETVSGYVESDNTDCDDTKSSVNPTASELCDGLDNDCDNTIDNNPIDGATYYLDSDGDGYGDTDSSVSACDDPSDSSNTYVAPSGDCDDSNSGVNPGIVEECSATEDLNCDGQFGSDVDTDGDGFTTCDSTNPDCNDSDENINPNATEVCDDVDNNCDGTVDESTASDAVTWYADSDADGFGDSDTTQSSCDPISGFVSDDQDCDDTRDSVYPGATETCDTVFDDDCDGDTNDPGATNGSTFYEDADADTHGNIDNTIVTCTVPSGYATSNDDCDDTSSSISPSAQEVCDGVDNDCDDEIDDADASVDTSSGTTYYLDSDNDLYGDQDTNNSVQACSLPAGYRANALDCNDSDYDIKPNATEVCDGVDNDCDGDTDADDSSLSDGTTYYTDGDEDGFGDPAAGSVECTQPSGTVTDNTDCDDSNGAINPSATELVADSVDQNCDNQELCYVDSDTDGVGGSSTGTSSSIDCSASGFSLTNTDCVDSDSNTFPGAAPNDSTTECMTDADGDDYGDTSAPSGGSAGTDCDDSNASINATVTYYADTDEDGFGDNSSTNAVCSSTPPNGFVADNTDCVDSDSNTFPGAAPNDSASACMTDADGDDYGDTSAPSGGSAGTDCDDSNASINATVTYYADTDEDGFGDNSSTNAVCSSTPPNGFVADNTDCVDTDVNTFPGAAPNDSTTECMTDADGDDYGDTSAPSGGSAGTDCDDSNASINESVTYYIDGDEDGFGDNNNTTSVCSGTPPSGAVTDNTDCDDSDGTVNPSATELVADSVDQNCDNQELCYVDSDTDGVGGSSTGTSSSIDCSASGFSLTNTDCDDSDGTVTADQTYYTDSDGDGFGLTSSTTTICASTAPNGFASESDDCDDGDENRYPNAPETCNDGIDSDCDGGDNTQTCDSNLASADSTILGENVNDLLGYTLSHAGDLDGDGTPDFALGARTHGSGGAVYIFDGLPGSNVSASTADAKLTGTSSEVFGSDMSGGLALTEFNIDGDINGDGNDDLIVGALRNDDNGNDAGAVYVFYGPITGNVTTAGADAVLQGGASKDLLGRSVTMVGDVNGDSIGDFLISAHKNDFKVSDSGRAYLFYGASGSNALSGTKSLELGAPPADVIFDTYFSGTRLGSDLAPAGDLTGDGINEILVGAEYYDRYNYDGVGCNPDPDVNPTCNNRDEGAAIVWEGGSFTSHRQFDFTEGNTSNFAAHALMLGEGDQDRVGYSVHGVGDVNGDGTNDFIAASPYYDGSGSDMGVAYVISGNASGVEDLGSSSNVISKIVGTNANESFGRSVGALGDINGDGTNDFVVGAKGADENGADSGAAFIFLGPVSGTINSNTADSIFAGANAGDEVGTGAVTAGDLDGNGRPDILIGAHHYTSGSTFQGGAFIILGENY